MTDIIEQMARAIGSNRYGWSWEETCDQLQQDMRKDARAAFAAALECMREPSEEMLAACNGADRLDTAAMVDADSHATWQAMLSQLRKEALE